MSQRSTRAAALLVATALAGFSFAEDQPITGFAPAQSVSAANVPSGILAADFDGDDDVDWATYDVTTSLLKIRRNDGTGLVYASNGFSVEYGLTDMAVGDFDHDGRPDLALATFGGVIIARNLGVDGNGTLQFDVSPRLPRTEGAEYRRIATGDYDGDLADDVVAAGAFTSGTVPGAGILSVWLSDGAGGFDAPVDRIYDFDVPTAVAIGDLTGDGWAEIVVASVNVALMRVYFNPHTGAVDVAATNDDTVGIDVDVTSLVIADVTRDGRRDIIGVGADPARPAGDNVRALVFPTDAAPRKAGIFHLSLYFAMADVFTAPPVPPDARCVVADINGDGYLDVVATSRTKNQVVVMTFDEPVRLPNGDVDDLDIYGVYSFAAGTAPVYVAAGDVSGDGKPDLLTIGTGSSASLLVNVTEGGGGGADAYPAAVKLAVKSKTLPGNRFQDGNKFTFTCEQTTADVGVFLQTSETPGDEASWADLPLVSDFKKGKGASVKWTLVAKHVPAGTRYFRTVTAGPDLDDGVNTALPTSGADDRYIGPFEVLSKGPVVVYDTLAYPGSDLATRTTTHLGDSVTYITTVRNSGSEAATGLRIQMRLPQGTQLDELYTSAGWTWLDPVKRDKIQWELDTLAARAKTFYVMTVFVTGKTKRGTTDVVKLDDVSVGADKGRSFRDGESRITLRITTPIRLAVTARGGAPTPGGLLEYDLTATNLGSTTLLSAVAWDRLPRGVAFELGYFVDANGDPIVSPVAGPAGRSNAFFERSTRKVFWYLGDMAPGQVQHLRLVTRVAYDQVIGNVLVNGAYELRGCSLGRSGCDPLRLDTLDIGSPGPLDVRTTVAGPYPVNSPVLRLRAVAVADDGAKIYDPRYGDVAIVGPGDEVAYFHVVGNSGGVTARRVRLAGNLPNGTTLVAGSVTVRAGFGPAGPATHTISTGGSLDVDLGDVGATPLIVSYRALVAPNVKDRTALVSRDFHLTTDALAGIIFANPSPLNVLVALPYVPVIETHAEQKADGSPVGEGDTVSFFTTWANVGGRAGSGDLTQSVPAGCSFLDATFFDGFDNTVAAFDADGSPVGVHVVSYKLTPTKKKLVVSLGTLQPQAKGKARFRFTLAKTPKSRVLTTQAGLGGKVATGAKDGTAVAPTTFTANLRVEGDDSPQLFVARIAPHVVRTQLEFTYTCIVGNTSDNEARGVVMTMDAPSGTRPTQTQSASEFGTDGRVKGRTATWSIGTLAPHAVAVRAFRVIVDDDAGETGNAIIEGTLLAKSDNAVGWRLSPQASLILVSGYRFESYAWPSVTVNTSAIGMVLGTDQPAGLDDAIRALRENTASVMSCGTDLVQFVNGAILAKVGTDLAFAFGNKNDVTVTSGTVVESFGDTRAVVASPDAIRIHGIPAHPAVSATDVFTAPVLFVDDLSANLIAGAGYNLIARDGRTVLGLDGLPAGVVKQRLTSVVPAGGGNLVAAGGGNIIAAGAGNLVGNDGATLVGNDGASLVAAGGGNLVAAGGGNLVAAGGGNLVAAGAGNLVAAGGGNLVAAGGGNLVAAGGGN